MTSLLMDWPYLGLAGAAALLLWLFVEERPSRGTPRGRDPAFVLGLFGPMYLLHQFEEHGVDLLGRHYAFLGALCHTLGYPSAATCPADPGFIAAVNPGAVWIAAALVMVFRRRRPLIAACVWGIALVNAGTHIGAALVHRAYNPGLVTAVVLFVPLCVWMLRTTLAAGVITRRQVPRVIVSGALVHGVLLVSLLARVHGLPYAALLAINLANGLTPWAVAAL